MMVVRGLVVCASVTPLDLIKANEPITALDEGLKMDFLSFARREKNQSQTG